MYGLVIGTRPSFIMAAPVIAAFDAHNTPLQVLHSSQHYSENMNAVFFEDLGIRPPDHVLPMLEGAISPARQISAIMIGVEDWLLQAQPQALMVLGDTNSNLGAAIACRKLNIPLAHIEAGERSTDLNTPEEQNRRIIDHISDLNFATNAKSSANLAREGIAPERVMVVGNTIVDTIFKNRARAAAFDSTGKPYAPYLDAPYAVMTLHRQENVDNAARLADILDAVSAGAAALKQRVLFFAHPRTHGRLREFGLFQRVEDDPNIALLEGVGYIEFVATLLNAAFCVTDSGGVQQECCVIGKPSVTVMESTPWPETIEAGGNEICCPGGVPIEGAMARAQAKADAGAMWGNPFGDGTTGEKIHDGLISRYS